MELLEVCSTMLLYYIECIEHLYSNLVNTVVNSTY